MKKTDKSHTANVLQKNTQKHLMHDLYVELVKLQKEIIASGLKLLVILEGRDAAGKDSMIKRIIKHLSPRETRVVALGKPGKNGEWYFQRYTAHLPADGEFVIFNRSWYNRAGVEHVMKFCTEEQYRTFFKEVEMFEKMLTDAGIIIRKYYLDISKKEQAARLEDRKENPLKQWKISPIDNEALKRWKAYSEARDEMLRKTSFSHAPWWIADAEEKKDVHIALISHLLSQMNYKDKNDKLVEKNYGLVYPATPDNIRKRLYK